jgi:hypothetical protein
MIPYARLARISMWLFSACVTVISLGEIPEGMQLASMKSTTLPKTNTTAPAGGVGTDPPEARASGDRALASETDRPFREARLGWLMLAVVWAASAAYLDIYLRQGWTAFDAGMLAQEALRTLHGQVPHRDFGDLYTGGLPYLDALAFRLFGVNLFSLRIPLFLFFLGWVPSVYFIARRFAAPLAAGALTLLAVAWSVPNYAEAMPSWYNLYFATWGVLALLRYTETKRNKWLWIAGLCGGLSFLVKISGLYFIAAGLLFFVFHEQSVARNSAANAGRGGISYPLFATGGLTLFLTLLTSLIAQRPTAGEFFQFVLPSGCLVAFLLWEAWRLPWGSSAGRFGHLFGEALPFLAGALAPVIVFLQWFASRGALGAWFAGVFIRPAMRTHWSAYDAISVTALAGLLPAALILVAALDSNRFARRLARWAGPVTLAALLLAAWKWLGMYAFVGYSPPLLVPVLALAMPLCLRRSAGLSERKRQHTFLLISAAVLCALIQFPFSTAIYFEYVAPLVILAIGALLALRARPERIALGAVLAFYFIYAVWLHTPGYYLGLGLPPRWSRPMQTLALSRAEGIRAPAPIAEQYRALIPFVQAHAKGPYIYATPDVPAVYFLSGFHNPTPTISDLLDPDFLNPIARDQRILRTLKTHEVKVVVLGPGDRTLAGKVQPGLRALLDARYPDSATIGKFEVRWKP